MRTFWSWLIGRSNSLKRIEAVHVVVAFYSLRGEAADEIVHVFVVEEVVGLVVVDDEQSGVPETICLVITHRLKARIFWSRLIGRKCNSLKDEAAEDIVHVV